MNQAFMRITLEDKGQGFSNITIDADGYIVKCEPVDCGMIGGWIDVFELERGYKPIVRINDNMEELTSRVTDLKILTK
jgi:hypothetical protein